jgi:hypothetical protein
VRPDYKYFDGKVLLAPTSLAEEEFCIFKRTNYLSLAPFNQSAGFASALAIEKAWSHDR